MMQLHVITAVTRPGNLTRLAESLAAVAPAVRITWHARFDPEQQHVGGQRLKNELLDQIADGWVWIGDDDNLMHPAFANLVPPLTANPAVGLIVLSQALPDGGVRRAEPGCLAIDRVDAAQLVVRRDVLGALRLPETYAGDGMLAEALAATLPPESICYVAEPAAYYNRLAWER